MQDPTRPGATERRLAHARERQACIRQAALLLGAGEPDAQAFADTGSTLVDGIALHVVVLARPTVPGSRPRSSRGPPPWPRRRGPTPCCRPTPTRC
jgi:hypothetical protein